MAFLDFGGGAADQRVGATLVEVVEEFFVDGHGKSARLFHRRAEFGEHAVGGFGVEESDEFVRGAFERFFVNELATGVFGLRELVFDIVRGEGDVMDAAVRVFSRNLAIGLSGEVGSSNSRCVSPTWKKAVRTFWLGTSSTRSHFRPSAFS